ncbi:MAG TPA: hypothetical protein DCR20_09160 [Planctomycetaceae bacterium]|nr:hypothetical protein [Planctomycetaceae bacterium]
MKNVFKPERLFLARKHIDCVIRNFVALVTCRKFPFWFSGPFARTVRLRRSQRAGYNTRQRAHCIELLSER